MSKNISQLFSVWHNVGHHMGHVCNALPYSLSKRTTEGLKKKIARTQLVGNSSIRSHLGFSFLLLIEEH